MEFAEPVCVRWSRWLVQRSWKLLPQARFCTRGRTPCRAPVPVRGVRVPDRGKGTGLKGHLIFRLVLSRSRHSSD